eukprot:gene19175-929_t
MCYRAVECFRDLDEEDDGLRAILEPEDFYAMKQNAEHKHFYNAPEISEDLLNDKEVLEFVRTIYRNQEKLAQDIWRGHKLSMEAEILTQHKEKEFQVALTKREGKKRLDEEKLIEAKRNIKLMCVDDIIKVSDTNVCLLCDHPVRFPAYGLWLKRGGFDVDGTVRVRKGCSTFLCNPKRAEYDLIIVDLMRASNYVDDLAEVVRFVKNEKQAWDRPRGWNTTQFVVAVVDSNFTAVQAKKMKLDWYIPKPFIYYLDKLRCLMMP